MSITKFPSAFAAAFLGVRYALAQAETRLPEAGVIAWRDEAQAYTPVDTSTGAKIDTHLCDLPVSVVVIPKEVPRAKRCAARRRVLQGVQLITVRHVPVTPLARRASCQFLME